VTVTVTASAPPQAVSFAQALRWWLRLGFISFGGPAGQIAIMHAELVEKRRWISERRFLHALNYCMVLPGPEAQQLATYIGWLMHGARGGIAAGALFVLPSLLILVALSWAYLALGHLPAVAGALWGIKPAVTAIVLHAGWRIGRRTLRNAVLVTIAVAAFAALALGAPFPAVILAAGAAGWLGGRLAPRHFAPPPAPAGAAVAGGALIDDDTHPPHTRFARGRFLRHVAAGLLLWAVAAGALAWAFGGEHLLTRMAGFFTTAALLTFGGAYAVLPFVVQAAVVDYGWLTTAQMIDGLALGETTPGPLIMIVAFVGFVGGWQQAVFGPEHLLLAGTAAACVATFFTFLPSFLFILAGAPLVESTRGNLRVAAPLTAITAAVAGVIGSLALYFTAHVLWPAAGFDAAAALLGLVAAVALFRFNAGIIPVIAASALAGLALSLA
jgi:chromate transporter